MASAVDDAGGLGGHARRAGERGVQGQGGDVRDRHVDLADPEGRVGDAVVADAGEVRHGRGEQLAAGAQTHGADLLAAGDLADRVGGVQERLRVGVEVPVGVLGVGLRQLVTNTCSPRLRAYSMKLRSLARSRM